MVQGSAEREDPRVVRLLGVIAVLLGVQVVALGVGAAWTVERLGALQAQLDRQRAQWGPEVSSWADRLEGLGTQIGQRQGLWAEGLAANARRTETDLGGLRQRRARLEAIPANPLAKIDRLIQLNQLLADEQLALLANTVRAQRTLAGTVAPLRAKR